MQAFYSSSLLTSAATFGWLFARGTPFAKVPPYACILRVLHRVKEVVSIQCILIAEQFSFHWSYILTVLCCD